MAQQASPNWAGQIADWRAHWTSHSNLVVMNGSSGSSPCSCVSAMTCQPPCSHSLPYTLALCSLLLRLRPRTTHGRAPIEHALAPDVDVSHQQDQEEREDLDVAVPAKHAERQRPRIQECDFDVEQQKDHRHEVELHRVAFTRVTDRRHAALVG